MAKNNQEVSKGCMILLKHILNVHIIFQDTVSKHAYQFEQIKLL